MPFDRTHQEQVLQAVGQWARMYSVATILGMERITEAGRQIAAFVIDARGQVQGYQTKNQLDPSEDRFYVPGNTRRLFEIKGIKFGVAICHEGWRYPETVRWAAVRGAKIVFHPQHTGNEKKGVRLTEWGAAGGPYYEKAMMMRSMENTIYFASVNYALRFQESATSLIAPSGQCQAYLPYGQEGVLVQAHQSRGSDRFAGRSIRTRALSRTLEIRYGQTVGGIRQQGHDSGIDGHRDGPHAAVGHRELANSRVVAAVANGGIRLENRVILSRDLDQVAGGLGQRPPWTGGPARAGRVVAVV